MSVTSVGLVGRSSTINEKFERTYIHDYVVFSDDIADSEYLIRTSLGFSLFAGHPDDAAARLKSIDVRLTEVVDGGDGGKWSATLEYGVISPLEGNSSGLPTDFTPQIVIEGVTYERIYEKDIISGNPIINSAGDAFDPPIVGDATRAVIKVTAYLTGVPITGILGWSNQVNDSIWRGFAAYTLKIDPPRITPHYFQSNDTVYSMVELTINYRSETWQAIVLDQGYRTLSSSKQYAALDGNMQVDTKPIPLNGSGAALTPPITSSTAHYLTFDIYNHLAFTAIDTALSLPVTLWT